MLVLLDIPRHGGAVDTEHSGSGIVEDPDKVLAILGNTQFESEQADAFGCEGSLEFHCISLDREAA